MIFATCWLPPDGLCLWDGLCQELVGRCEGTDEGKELQVVEEEWGVEDTNDEGDEGNEGEACCCCCCWATSLDAFVCSESLSMRDIIFAGSLSTRNGFEHL